MRGEEDAYTAGFTCGYDDGCEHIQNTVSPELLSEKIEGGLSNYQDIYVHWEETCIPSRRISFFASGYRAGYATAMAENYLAKSLQLVSRKTEKPLNCPKIEEEYLLFDDDSSEHDENAQDMHTGELDCLELPQDQDTADIQDHLPSEVTEPNESLSESLSESDVNEKEYEDELLLDIKAATELYNKAKKSIALQNDFHDRYVPVPFGIEVGHGALRQKGDLTPFKCGHRGERLSFFVCRLMKSDADMVYVFPSFGYDSKDELTLTQGGFNEFFETIGGYRRHSMRLIMPAVCRLSGDHMDTQHPVKNGIIEQL